MLPPAACARPSLGLVLELPPWFQGIAATLAKSACAGATSLWACDAPSAMADAATGAGARVKLPRVSLVGQVLWTACWLLSVVAIGCRRRWHGQHARLPPLPATGSPDRRWSQEMGGVQVERERRTV